MKYSLQERFQCGEDDLPDVVADAIKELQYDGPARWPFFVESYMRRGAELCLQFGIRRAHEVVARHFVAVLERASVHLHDFYVEAPTRVMQNTEADPPKLESGVQQATVFVFVLQRVEQEQRVRAWRVRSEARLQTLEGFLHIVRRVAADPHAFETPVVRGLATDREGYLRLIRAGDFLHDDAEGEVFNRDPHEIGRASCRE